MVFVKSSLAVILVLFSTDQIVATSNDVLSFLLLGDWGGIPSSPYYTAAQSLVSKSMNTIAEKIDSSFIVALGDNFYYNGVINSNSARFTETWDNVYTGAYLQTPWYVLAGNHDHYGNVTAQIAYSSESDRWTFPSLYYKKSFTTGDGKTTIDMVMIDTVDLAGAHNYAEDDSRYFDKLPLKSRHAVGATNQWLWIEEQLQASTADYLLVMGHYPVYSVCDHGSTETLVAELLPMLEKYQGIYFSGHDHCSEHIQPIGSLVPHYLIGMGVECCYDASNLKDVPTGSTQWYMASDNHGSVQGGFASVSISSSSLQIQFYDESGNILYTAPVVNSRSRT